MAMITVSKNATIDDHIGLFPASTQKKLKQLRALIRKAAPGATECINYGIPTYQLEGNLVHFSGYKSHIGFYPGASGIEHFKKELSAYKGSKGTVQFSLDEELPAALITRMVKLRVKQNQEKAALKKDKKKARPKPLEKTRPNDEESVKKFMAKLDPGAKSEMEAVRKIIKSASPYLKERIKWNAPSYYYGADIVTFGPYKTHKLLLVFHHPAVVKVVSPLLEGDYKDRRLVRFANKAAATKNKSELVRIIRAIMRSIDNKK
jgi:uncharacterized protein YdhG (YjbR/CyaY superfamily)